MNIKSIRILLSVSLLALGSYIGLKDINYAFYIFGICCVLIGLLLAKANLRNKNYIGILFTTRKELGFKLTEHELTAGISIVSFMLSPFIGMIMVSLYGK